MEYDEVLAFLSDSKHDVVEQAANVVLELSEDAEFLDYIRENPKKVARPLLRVLEREDFKSQFAGLNAVVNLSAVPEVAESMLDLKGIRRTCDVMENLWNNGVDKDAVELCTMVLSNLTTIETGQTMLCTEKKSLGFLVPLYLSPPVSKTDIMFHIGSILKNITGIREGRAFVAQANIVKPLAHQFAARQRRAIVVDIFRNLASDKECHEVLSDCDFLPSMQCFLYPDNAEKPDHTTLHPVVESGRQGLTKDEGVRFNVAEMLVFLARTRIGRESMRRDHVYECVRAWHLEETQDDVKDMLESLVPCIHFSEDELKAEGLEAEGATESKEPEEN